MDSCHSIAVIGQHKSLEMKPIIEFLTTFSGTFRISYYPDIQLFFHAIHQQAVNFDIVLVLQNRPLEYTFSDIRKLIHAYPLSHILCCYSSWSESDGRNHPDHWPVSFRIPARAAIPLIQNVINILEGNKNYIPLSSGKEEVFQNRIPETLSLNSISSDIIISIESPDLEFSLMLEDLLKSISSHLKIKENSLETSICLWDADPLNEFQRNKLSEFRNQFPNSIIIPLMNFPQPNDTIVLQQEFCTTEAIPKLHLTHFLTDQISKSVSKLDSLTAG